MYLIFDTSGNGAPRNWKGENNDPFNWPRLMHLAWLYYDENRKLIGKGNELIKPEGWAVKPDFGERYHVTAEELEEKGRPVREVLIEFRDVVDSAKHIISHNLRYNEGVIGGEMARSAIAHRLHHSDNYCLMQEATWMCKLAGRGGKYKWPSLNEIYGHLFQKKFGNAGNANTDAAVTALAFFKMLDNEAIELF
jgi:DNA polymerase-3 subunit alpha